VTLLAQLLEEFREREFYYMMLEREVEELREYKALYLKLLGESTSFAEQMSAELLKAALHGKIGGPPQQK
jgi:hypothetical protein